MNHRASRYKPESFTKRFVKRTRELREAAGYTSHKEMAAALGVPAQTYYHYETRSCLPHHLMPQFARLTGISLDDLIAPADETAFISSTAGREFDMVVSYLDSVIDVQQGDNTITVPDGDVECFVRQVQEICQAQKNRKRQLIQECRQIAGAA